MLLPPTVSPQMQVPQSDELDRFAHALDGLQGLQCSLTNPRFGTSRRPFQVSHSFREPGL